MTHVRTPRSLTLTALVAAGLVMTTAAEGPSASDGVARLKAGNARFVANPAAPLPIDAAQRAAVSRNQAPFAGVLSCTDARVPPEVVFHAGLGDLFVVRSAAQVTDRSVLASLEHAVDRLHIPLVVVMGHESCDIVQTTGAPTDSHAAEHALPGAATVTAGHAPGQPAESNVEYLARQIRPAWSRSASVPSDLRQRAAILENVEEQINALLAGSPLLRRKAESGQVALVGAYYELTSGSVHFSEIVKVAPTVGEVTQAPQPPQHQSPVHH